MRFAFFITTITILVPSLRAEATAHADSRTSTSDDAHPHHAAHGDHEAHGKKHSHSEAKHATGKDKKQKIKDLQIDGSGNLADITHEPKAHAKETAPAISARDDSDEERLHRLSQKLVESDAASEDKTKSKSKLDHFYDPDEDDDMALDELEALTLQATLEGKHFGPPGKVNCKWTSWEESGSCSKTCGGGEQKMTRKQKPAAAWHGSKCNGGPTKTEDCEKQDCPTTTTTTTAPPTAAGALRASDFDSFTWAVAAIVLPLIAAWAQP